MIARSSAPALWHTDLHFGNIFVSTDDPTFIEGIIDWQSSVVAPLFLQYRMPGFLKPPNEYTRGTKAPQLPDNFDQLDTILQQRAILEKKLATRWKLYEMYCLTKNRDVYIALGLDRRLWEPFARCGESSSNSIVPLRGNLIRLLDDWGLLGLSAECPFAFTTDELKKHKAEATRYQDRVDLQALVRDQLGTDDEGWVSLSDWDSVKAENQRPLHMFVETMVDEMSKEEAINMWPFCDEPSLVG